MYILIATFLPSQKPKQKKRGHKLVNKWLCVRKCSVISISHLFATICCLFWTKHIHSHVHTWWEISRLNNAKWCVWMWIERAKNDSILTTKSHMQTHTYDLIKNKIYHAQITNPLYGFYCQISSFNAEIFVEFICVFSFTFNMLCVCYLRQLKFCLPYLNSYSFQNDNQMAFAQFVYIYA